ncbi:MAG: hypothetical protein DHS20C05_22020 [Hyphococcus sp.]|nr:MAG: hypothetical protein DHS20C05_22020 [Marinicaulis sp.]
MHTDGFVAPSVESLALMKKPLPKLDSGYLAQEGGGILRYKYSRLESKAYASFYNR